jgi:outer membrane protein assembly factor BamD
LRRTLLTLAGFSIFATGSSAGAQSSGQTTTPPPASTQATLSTSGDSKKEAKQDKGSILPWKKKKDATVSSDTSAAPDKLLYDRAQVDIKKGRHEVGRLNLQTLINTYPDSEYLAKAKLSIADSYYKEGGTANLTQAIAGYKDFIVFFPFLPEASYAQVQVAMTHFKEMQKPDRDKTEARAAEEEFQTFMMKYPKDPLVPKAEQHLRIVQEVLAEGEFRIGSYYYTKGDRRAAAGRLLSVVKRYPLYSRSDETLWMLGDIFEKSEKKEIASVYYAKIVKSYPLSPLVGDAKAKLVAFGVPVPQADPKALAWMQAEASAPRPKEGPLTKPMSMIRTGPNHEKVVAAQSGTPTMEQDTDTTSVADVLGGGAKSSISLGSASGTGNTAVVDVATPGTGAAGGSTVEAGDTGTTTTPDPNATPATDAPPPPAANADGTATPVAGTSTDGTTPAANADPNAKPADPSATPVKESTSKKKKGIKKVIPW